MDELTTRSTPREVDKETRLPTTKFEVEWNSTIAQRAKGENMRKEILKGFTMVVLTVALAFAVDRIYGLGKRAMMQGADTREIGAA